MSIVLHKLSASIRSQPVTFPVKVLMWNSLHAGGSSCIICAPTNNHLSPCCAQTAQATKVSSGYKNGLDCGKNTLMQRTLQRKGVSGSADSCNSTRASQDTDKCRLAECLQHVLQL